MENELSKAYSEVYEILNYAALGKKTLAAISLLC